MERKEREIWVDYVKVIACVLVVLGHFFQSMTKANIIPDNSLYRWFNATIYYFHVPLFFICSGYLFQKYSSVSNIRDWFIFVLNKLISLGIPYFTFSIISWTMKKVFSATVNSEVGGFFETLFVEPISPYWYLYILFFMFVVSVPFTISRKEVPITYILLAVFLKVGSYLGGIFDIYFINRMTANYVWFILGMSIAFFDFPSRIYRETSVKKYHILSGTGILLFLLISIIVRIRMVEFAGMSALLCLLICVSIITLFISMFGKGNSCKIFDFFSKYTMPLFLLHTLFAAPLRSILLKIGITNPVVHITCGLAISFAGPIVAAEIMKRIPAFEVLVYPSKYIKVKRRNKNGEN